MTGASTRTWTRHIFSHTATHCNTLQHTATHCNAFIQMRGRRTKRDRNTGGSRWVVPAHWHDSDTHSNTLQHTATHCNTLQHTATHCNTLQHTATHCNTLQHTATHLHEWEADEEKKIETREVADERSQHHPPWRVLRQIDPVCCSVLQCVAVCCSV